MSFGFMAGFGYILFWDLNVKKNKFLFNAAALSFMVASSVSAGEPLEARDVYRTTAPIVVDGAMDDAWQAASWRALDKAIIGELPQENDFSGRYKLLWDENYLYLLTEITDEKLFDQHSDPLFKYWDDDCLEVFVDENNSGGNHQFNFNAFAYHIALDGHVADIGPNNPDGSTHFILLDDHLESKWKVFQQKPQKLYWEVALKIYPETFTLENRNAEPVKLTEGKDMGFMLAYCDNDQSEIRESFVGDVEITPKNGDKNLGYIDASVFAPIKLRSAKR